MFAESHLQAIHEDSEGDDGHEDSMGSETEREYFGDNDLFIRGIFGDERAVKDLVNLKHAVRRRKAKKLKENAELQELKYANEGKIASSCYRWEQNE